MYRSGVAQWKRCIWLHTSPCTSRRTKNTPHRFTISILIFQKELKSVFAEAKVFTTDANPDYASACRISDGYFKMQRVTEPNYIDDLLQLAIKNDVKIIRLIKIKS